MYLVTKSELNLARALKPADLDTARDGRYSATASVAVNKEYSEVTNGHFLIREYFAVGGERLPVSDFPAAGMPEKVEPNGAGPILVPAVLAREAAAGIPKNSTTPILNTALVGRQNGSVVLQSTDLESYKVSKGLAGEGRWPDTDKVFPSGDPVATVGFSPDYFERIGKVFRERGVKAIKLELFGDGKPAKFSGAMPNGGRLEAILMPMRLS